MLKTYNKLICRICNNSNNNKLYKTKEMMFGFRDEFSYFQCSECNCMQIEDIPSDMSRYYPNDYYSFSLQPFKNPVKKMIKKIRDNYALTGCGIVGKLCYGIWPNQDLRLLSNTHLRKEMKILDVGCGLGSFLYSLKEVGFKNLLGIDPFIEEDFVHLNGLRIEKKYISEVGGLWDLIVLNHSLEHVPNQIEMLQFISNLLSNEGTCIIRIPVISSLAWEKYGTDWVQFDAPRHFFLHSVKSLQLLAEKSNLKVKKIVFDSTAFQFWGSEQYLKNIPLCSNEFYSSLSREEIKKFDQEAKRLNKQGRGDQAAFFLQKKDVLT